MAVVTIPPLVHVFLILAVAAGTAGLILLRRSRQQLHNERARR